MTSSADASSRSPIVWIMAAILAWAVVLAGGVLLYDYQHDQVNWLKPAIIVGAPLLFLGMWALALRRRRASSSP